jgi:hypothetical protein
MADFRERLCIQQLGGKDDIEFGIFACEYCKIDLVDESELAKEYCGYMTFKEIIYFVEAHGYSVSEVIRLLDKYGNVSMVDEY